MTKEEFIESIKLEGEEWRDVVGYNRYSVSTFGRVISNGKPYLCGSRICVRQPQLLKPRNTSGNPGYMSVRLSNGKRQQKCFMVHRLVAKAFIPNPNNLPYINHKDENSLNNKATNLEWCTQQYNCNYGTHNIRMARTISETAYQRKAVVQLSLAGEFISNYISIASAARSLGISHSIISLCCRHKIPCGRGFIWMYLPDYKQLISKSKNS